MIALKKSLWPDASNIAEVIPMYKSGNKQCQIVDQYL